MDYLSEEEQYAENLSHEDIDRIRDPELRRIRKKCADTIRRNHEDVENFSDEEVQEAWMRLKQEEKAEIAEYRKRRGEQ